MSKRPKRLTRKEKIANPAIEKPKAKAPAIINTAIRDALYDAVDGNAEYLDELLRKENSK